MTNPTLKLIIKLLSIFNQIDDNLPTEKTRPLIESYLKSHIDKEFVKQFMDMYDFYLSQNNSKEKIDFYKKLSLKSVKAIRLLYSINNELRFNEKISLLVLLLEILKYKDRIHPNEYDFVETIAIAFNIDDKEYNNLKNFILMSWQEIPFKENTILINSKKIGHENNYKHILRENLDGYICILYIQSTNQFFFYYDGNDNLFLNGREILVKTIYPFQKGNSISSYKIGFQNFKLKPVYYTEVGMIYFHDTEFIKTTINITDVEFHYKNTKHGIQKFNFSSESYLLTGIIGASGAGKSTLLNILNGNLKPQSGQVFINGYDLHDKNDKDRLKGIIGFVSQDDFLFENLTVFQNLYFNAKLCFSNYSEEKIIDTVHKVLKDLDLFKIKDLLVGDATNKIISGGQRKRLNIGMELMREPSILIVDEPTSGLSSSDSMKIIDILREQTLKGKLVIINIHQPSSSIFKLLDQLIVIDIGGYCVYTGDPLESVVYFKTINKQINPLEKECPNCGNINPDVILEVIEEKTICDDGTYSDERKIKPEKWHQYYKENIEEKSITLKPEKEKLPIINFKIPNKFNQFRIFSLRNLLSKLSNKQYLLISLLEAPILAIILGYFSKYNIGTAENPKEYLFIENLNLPAYLLISIIVSLFLGLLVSAEEIIRDKKILIREKFLNLSRTSYINSKIIFLFSLSAIQTLSYVLIGNYILEIKGLTLHYWIILFSIACCANMLGLNISSGLKSVIAIYVLIPFLIIPQILFSGTIVKFDKLHSSLTSKLYPPIIADLMPSRWAFEALVVTQFQNNKFEKNYFNVEKYESEISYMLNYLIPKLISINDECQTILISNGNSSLFNEKMNIIINEIKKLKIDHPEIENMMTDFNLLSYSEKNNKVNEILDYLKNYYANLLEKILYKKDQVTHNLVKEFNNTEKYIDFKNQYYNNSIADLVLKSDEKEKSIIIDHQIYQKYEPIFLSPSNHFGRAHHYSHQKKVQKTNINTFLFNISIIWIFNLLLFISLKFDLLYIIINRFKLKEQ